MPYLSNLRQILIIKISRSDNDQYSHLNNSVYNLIFDSIINKYLIEHCQVQPGESSTSTSPIGLVVSSWAQFFRPLSFPDRLLVGMRVVSIGNSSVSYEVGVFGPVNSPPSTTSNSVSPEIDNVAVVGGFTHVFVERDSRTAAKKLPESLREGLLRLMSKGTSLYRL